MAETATELQTEAKEKYITGVKKGLSDYVTAVSAATGEKLATKYVQKIKAGLPRFEKNVAKPETKSRYIAGLSRFVGGPIRGDIANKFAANLVEKGIPNFREYVTTGAEERSKEMGAKWESKKAQFIENYRTYAANPDGERWLRRFLAGVRASTAMG